jgi:hypothetical protein
VAAIKVRLAARVNEQMITARIDDHFLTRRDLPGGGGGEVPPEKE